MLSRGEDKEGMAIERRKSGDSRIIEAEERGYLKAQD